MSLTHGHFYVAELVAAKLGDQLKTIITDNIETYRLGAIGPDLFYWTATFENLGARYPADDPHTGNTGQVVTYIVEEAIRQKNTGQQSANALMAFALGWITHWTTDLYIHTLVDQYGGNYLQNPSRHLQLELVETKHIHEWLNKKRASKDAWSLKNDNTVWETIVHAIFMSTYGVNVKKYKPGQEPEKFKRLLYDINVGYTAMVAAFNFAEEACLSFDQDIVSPTEYMKLLSLAIERANRSTISAKNIAGEIWESKGGYIPSQNFYKSLNDPISISVTPTKGYLDVEVKVADTGLYGKFLVDYKAFISGAVAHAVSIAEIIYEYLYPIKERHTVISALNGKSEWEILGYKERLCTALSNSGEPIDILTPDSNINMLASSFPAIAEFIKYNPTLQDGSARKMLHYECEIYFENESSPLTLEPKQIQIIEDGSNQLFGSNRAKAYFRIPFENINDLYFAYRFKVSLTNKDAFKNALYENIEYKIHESAYVNLSLITTCTAIEVGYDGPLSHNEEATNGDTYSQLAKNSGFCTSRNSHNLTVDSMNNLNKCATNELFWGNSEFTATIEEHGDNRPISMPGCPEEPIGGGWTHFIRITGKVDFSKQTVSFEAVEERKDICKGKELSYDKKSKRYFSACNLPVIDFGTDMVRFGVVTCRTLHESHATYTATDISNEYIYGNDTAIVINKTKDGDINVSKGSKTEKKSHSTEDILKYNLDEDGKNRCFYIEFRR